MKDMKGWVFRSGDNETKAARESRLAQEESYKKWEMRCEADDDDYALRQAWKKMALTTRERFKSDRVYREAKEKYNNDCWKRKIQACRDYDLWHPKKK